MENIHILPTKQTPEVFFDFDTCQLKIEGCCRPEDVEAFFGPILRKVNEQSVKLVRNVNKLDITIHMVYFNSSSLKFLLELLRTCVIIKGHDGISINWMYDKDDDDVLEVGHELSEALNSVFKFIEN